MRLLSVNNYNYRRGGAEVVFIEHNRQLENLGWDVIPFCMQHEQNEPSPWAKYFPEEIEFGRAYSLPERLRKAAGSVYSVEARKKVTALIDLVQPDICHAHNIYHHLSPAILGAIAKRKIPLVMTLHDLKIACPAYTMLSVDGVCERCRDGALYNVALHRCMKGSAALSFVVMIESYLHRILGSYSRHVNRFAVPSRFYLEKFVEWGFDRDSFTHLPNFIDTSGYSPRYKPGRRFVYFGRLSREKGLTTLIRAAARARVGVDVIGTGPESGALHALAQELGADVAFAGYLSGSALRDAVAAARAVVLPSEWFENAPLAVLEAYALGKPIIASSIGGLPELVTDQTGWVFKVGDVEHLADVLGEVTLLDDESVETIGRTARSHVVEHYSPERYVEELRRLYRSLGVSWP